MSQIDRCGRTLLETRRVKVPGSRLPDFVLVDKSTSAVIERSTSYPQVKRAFDAVRRDLLADLEHEKSKTPLHTDDRTPDRLVVARQIDAVFYGVGNYRDVMLSCGHVMRWWFGGPRRPFKIPEDVMLACKSCALALVSKAEKRRRT